MTRAHTRLEHVCDVEKKMRQFLTQEVTWIGCWCCRQPVKWSSRQLGDNQLYHLHYKPNTQTQHGVVCSCIS